MVELTSYDSMRPSTVKADLMANLKSVLQSFGIGSLDAILRLPDAVAVDCIQQCDVVLADGKRTRAVAHAMGRVRCPTAGDEALADRSLPPHDPALYAEHLSEPCAAIDKLAALVHAATIAVGWWNSPYTGEPKARNVFEMLALVHSEISEALEHHRKGTMDDKLPDRPGIEVELADALIRIADIAAALRLDLGGAVKAKLLFNQNRADHRPENRVKSGGKAA